MTSSTPSISVVLKGTALFSALSDAEVESLAKRTLIRSFTSGELLFSEGALCVGFYIVFKGRVRIFKVSPGGREQVLALEGPGSSIAELPVFDGGPYLKKVLEAEGIPTQTFALDPARANLVARLKGNGSKRPLLILAHTDVVGLQREKWPVEQSCGFQWN